MTDAYAAWHTATQDSLANPHTDSPSSVSDDESSPSHGLVGSVSGSFDEFMPNPATTFADSFQSASFADEDDNTFSDFLAPASAELPAGEASAAGPKRRSRRPPNTAERRATHNAVERARRETLNGRFMDLAAALPSMAHVKRPSKSMIVNKCERFVLSARPPGPALWYLCSFRCLTILFALAHTHTALDFIETALAREKALLEQNDVLRSQLNELRAQRGMGPLDETPALPPWNHKKKPVQAKQSNNTDNNKTNKNNSNSNTKNEDQKPVERRDSVMSVQSDQSHQSATSPRTVSSVETPNTDASGFSPKSMSTSLSASSAPSSQFQRPTTLSEGQKGPAGSVSGGVANSNFSGDVWGMRAQLQAAISNVGGFNPHTGAPLLSFDPFAQSTPQQQQQQPGALDLNSYLSALQRQQQQQQQQSSSSTYLQGIGAYTQSLSNLQPSQNPAPISSYPTQAANNNMFAGLPP